MIVCLRAVVVPPAERERYLDWIAAGRQVRQDHGILAELVVEPAMSGGGETVVITIWPSHGVFDACRSRSGVAIQLTASAVHAAVDYRPITRYDVVGVATAGGSISEPHGSSSNMCLSSTTE